MAAKKPLSNTLVAGNTILTTDEQGNMVAETVDVRDPGKDPINNAPAVQPQAILTRTEMEQEAGRQALARRARQEALTPKRPPPPPNGMEAVFRPGDHIVQQRDPATGAVRRFVVPAPNPNNPQNQKNAEVEQISPKRGA